MNKISILESQQVATKYNNYSNQSKVGVTKTKSINNEDAYIKTNDTLTPDVYTNKQVTIEQEKSSLFSEEDYEWYCRMATLENGDGVYFPPQNASDEEKQVFIDTCKKLEAQGEDVFANFKLGIAPASSYFDGTFTQRCAVSSTLEIMEDYLDRSRGNLTRGQGDLPKDVYDRYIKNNKKNIDVITDLINKLKAIKTK